MRTFFSVRALWIGILFVAIACTCCSCADTKKLTYLQGKFDTAELSRIEVKEPVIRKGDLLSIIIYSDNPAATALYNQQQTGSAGTGGATQSSGGGSSSGSSPGSTGSSTASTGGSPGTGGYLVDERGNIQFQGLGIMHVEGLSRSALKDTLEAKLAEYLSHPYCSIRFLNYRFTMLGEIAHPGIFTVPSEHINLLEALGMGGDLTFFGRRDNILVIREYNGKREFGRLDLTKPDVMKSPYFYLLPNDVVYVEATKKKIAANDQTVIRDVTVAASVISTLALLYSIFK